MKHVNKNNLFTQSLELYAEDNRTPLDCSGMTLKFLVKKSREDKDTECILPPIVYEKPDTNLFLFEYTASQIDLLEPGVYWMAYTQTKINLYLVFHTQSGVKYIQYPYLPDFS